MLGSGSAIKIRGLPHLSSDLKCPLTNLTQISYLMLALPCLSKKGSGSLYVWGLPFVALGAIETSLGSSKQNGQANVPCSLLAEFNEDSGGFISELLAESPAEFDKTVWDTSMNVRRSLLWAPVITCPLTCYRAEIESEGARRSGGSRSPIQPLNILSRIL